MQMNNSIELSEQRSTIEQNKKINIYFLKVSVDAQ